MAKKTPAHFKRDEEIVRLRVGEGMSTRMIAQRFGISHQWVSAILRQAGVDGAVKFNWKRDQEIIRLRKTKCLTHSEIAAQMGLTLSVVSGVLLRAGMKTVRPSLAGRNAEIVKLRKHGTTVQAIADKFGLQPPTVMEVLRKAGMTNAGYAFDREALDKRNAQIVRLRKQGLTILTISQMVGLTRNSVNRILAQAGQTRPRGSQQRS